MNAFEAIRSMIFDIEQSEFGSVNMIVTHPTLSARGYIFGIEVDDKIILLVSTLDWHRAIMQANQDGYADQIEREILYTPVFVDSEELAQKAVGGIYKWILKLP